MKVVIVAANISTRFGGEAILPWHYFRLLRKRGIEAWLVSHDRTRKELLELLPNEADWMLFVPDLLVQRWLNRLSHILPARVSSFTLGWGIHVSTSFMQRKIVRELVQRYHIDVVHEPVPVSPKLPSLMCGLGAPVVIGPMNGGMTYPPAFAQSQGQFERMMMQAAEKPRTLSTPLFPVSARPPSCSSPTSAPVAPSPRTRAAM